MPKGDSASKPLVAELREKSNKKCILPAMRSRSARWATVRHKVAERGCDAGRFGADQIRLDGGNSEWAFKTVVSAQQRTHEPDAASHHRSRTRATQRRLAEHAPALVGLPAV